MQQASVRSRDNARPCAPLPAGQRIPLGSENCVRFQGFVGRTALGLPGDHNVDLVRIDEGNDVYLALDLEWHARIDVVGRLRAIDPDIVKAYTRLRDRNAVITGNYAGTT